MASTEETYDHVDLREGLVVPSKPAEEINALWLRQQICQHGIAFVRSVHSPLLAKKLAALLGDVRTHRDANEDGITVVEPRGPMAGRNGLQGFSYQPLFPHTDRTIASIPPDLVFIWCEEASLVGGESVLVDALDVYSELCESFPEIVQQLCQPDAAVFESDGTFLRSPVFFRLAECSGRVSVRFRYDNLMYINCAYSAAVPVLKATIAAKATRLKLGPGEGYFVSNTRWLHGRSGFSGSRRFMRLHIDMHGRSDRGFAVPSEPWE